MNISDILKNCRDTAIERKWFRSETHFDDFDDFIRTQISELVDECPINGDFTEDIVLKDWKKAVKT